MNAIRRWLLDLPVARKLGLLLAVNTTLAVMAIAIVFTLGGALTRYHDAQQQLQALAEVVGENSRAALAFNDRPGASVVLEALRVKQDISLAVLKDSNDRLFVSRDFARPDDRLQAPVSALIGGLMPLRLTVTHRIEDSGVIIGHIELTSRLNDMWADVLENMGVMAFIGVALAVLAVYFGMRLRSLVIAPVLELARVSHWVSHSQDYSQRAARQGNDEVGRLVDDFNHMLSEIQARDRALRIERESLEERVDLRTAELKRAMDEATQANRVKSEFLSTVSHELRTPLTAISGSIGLLAGEALGPLPEQVLNLLKIAQKNGQRLALLINDLLDVEKLMAGKLRFDILRQPLMPLLEQALADNQAYAQTMSVKLALTDRIDDALVDVDALRLHQVLANLLSNAAKFSPKGGRVELGAHRMGDVVRVSVTDHGPGIAASFRHRVFEKFSQADSTDTRQKGGTGLGLAISREMIERMGGRIGFESEEGQGACFFFDLQLWYGNSGESVWSGLLSLPADAARILLLEKDADVARMIQRMLARAGYAVDHMQNDAAALAQAARPNHCAAVLMELSSEDTEAIHFVHQLRQQPATRGLPVIAISSEVERSRLALGEDAPGVMLVDKPVDQSRLAALLDKLVSPQRPRSLRVLHVEDNGQDHRAVLDMSEGRFDMELATTLKEARTRIELERFDVVVLDLTLPNESGWDLLPAIRARQPDARVVVLTGGSISAEEARRVDAVLKKDQLSPEQLVRVIDAHHERGETDNS